MSRLRRQRHALLTLTAVGALFLQAWGTVHLGLEAHTMGSDGSLIELHGSREAHAHDERSLCDASSLDASWFDGGPCEVVVDFALTEPDTVRPRHLESTRSAVVRSVDAPRSASGLWQLAPKGSPPHT